MHIIPGFEHLPRKFKTARLFIIIFGSACTVFFLLNFLAILPASMKSPEGSNEETKLMLPWMIAFIVMGLSFLFFGIRFPKVKRNKFRWFLMLSILMDVIMAAYILFSCLLVSKADKPVRPFEHILMIVVLTISCLALIAILLGFEIFVGKKIRAIERAEAELMSKG
jgi:uncharacterized membrane protein YozB (DUF420 family)